MSKIEIKEMKKTKSLSSKQKEGKKPFTVSPFFRFTIAFAVTLNILFITFFIFNFILSNSNAAREEFSQGQLLYKAGQYQDALDHLYEATGLEPKNIEYRLLLIECLEKSGDYSNMLLQISEGEELSPGAHEFAVFKMGYYFRQGQTDLALQELNSLDYAVKNRIISLQPQTPKITRAETEDKKIELQLTAAAGTRIYYTTNGKTPTVNDEYKEPIQTEAFTSNNTIIKVICTNEAGLISSLLTENYTLDPNLEYSFADPKIEQMVRLSLGRDDSDKITYSDLNLVYTLSGVDNSGNSLEGYIKTLTDLEEMMNIETLILKNETLDGDQGFEIIKKLPYLRTLSLEDCKVNTDMLQLIAECPELTSLTISDNGISDFSKISALSNLTYLNLSSNNISNLDFLKSMTVLKELRLDNSGIIELKGIENLKQLNILSLTQNNIRDITSLGDCPALNELYLSTNIIGDISALSRLNALKIIDLSYNQLTSIDALRSIATIEEINVTMNSISDFSPLKTSMPEKIVAQNCSIASLESFRNLNIQYLDISNQPQSTLNLNTFDSVQPLSGMAVLKQLYIRNNSIISSIEPLGGMKIDVIYCGGCTGLSFEDFINDTNIVIDN